MDCARFVFGPRKEMLGMQRSKRQPDSSIRTHIKKKAIEVLHSPSQLSQSRFIVAGITSGVPRRRRSRLRLARAASPSCLFAAEAAPPR